LQVIEPPVETVAVAAAVDVIVKVVVLGAVIIWNLTSSKLDALRPVPLGKVTLSNCTMSPAFAP